MVRRTAGPAARPTASAVVIRNTPQRVPVGVAWPGERVKISVPVTAPGTPGPCMVSWKMVDAEGRQLFPDARPVYFLVEVVD